MSYNFTMEDKKPIFTTASETLATSTTESYAVENRSLGSMDGVFSPLAPSFQSHAGSELISLLVPQEPRAGDIAPAVAEIDDEMLMNLRISNSDMFNDMNHTTNNDYFMGGARPESVASSNLWGEGSSTSTSGARNGEMIDTFDFLVKSLSSANNYVSMLTREQLSVLRSIRPSLLYEFLQEVAKVRSDKRMRRAAPNECAFCKNNGENEECYASHSLKDWRGRVLCPVLRAFRCPRCGATGDRAHTIKYCPENGDNGLERSGSFASRRRVSSSTSLLFGSHPASGSGSQQPSAPPAPPAPPAPSPSPASASFSHSSLWNAFNMN